MTHSQRYWACAGIPQVKKLSFPHRKLKPLNDSLLTKREILQESSSIFDPLGLLSPITVKGKMLIQLLWKRKFEWDEVLPEWCKLREDILKATETTFSRRYFPNVTPTDITVHVFTDASIKAYGACAYLVSGNQRTLIMAKNKVTPVKQLTVPKLELCAALLGARLSHHITSSINCNTANLWSDSQIVLQWINSPKIQPLFVSNRVKEIRELTKGFQWRYCPTDSNPADILSRGQSYETFRDNRLWIYGPSWLMDETAFPHKLIPDEETKDETTSRKSEAAVLTTTRDLTQDSLPTPGIDIKKFSSYRRLLRVTAYVIRFVNNCKNFEMTRGPLESREINTAAKQLRKHAQYRHFPEEEIY